MKICKKVIKKIHILLRNIVFALFFTPQEEMIIDHFLQSLNRGVSQKKIEELTFPLCVNGIVFTNDDMWTVWLNGILITPSNKKKLENIILHKVESDFIIISVKNNPQKITLKLYQMYNDPQ